jgi:hypothetical protein
MDDVIDVYPLTVIADRYTGVYSGGLFTAWNLDADEVPEAVFADDVSCVCFWAEKAQSYPVGIGNTIGAAIADLIAKVNNNSYEEE